MPYTLHKIICRKWGDAANIQVLQVKPHAKNTMRDSEAKLRATGEVCLRVAKQLRRVSDAAWRGIPHGNCHLGVFKNPEAPMQTSNSRVLVVRTWALWPM